MEPTIISQILGFIAFVVLCIFMMLLLLGLQKLSKYLETREEAREHKATYFYDHGTGNGDDREGFSCWCGWFTLGSSNAALDRSLAHAQVASQELRYQPHL